MHGPADTSCCYSVRFGRTLPGGARRASKVFITPSLSGRDAMQVLGHVVLGDIAHNLRAIFATGADANSVHQTRVHLRRMRVLISAADGDIRHKRAQRARRRAKDLMGSLRPLRNLDVQLAQLSRADLHVEHLARLRKDTARDVLKEIEAQTRMKGGLSDLHPLPEGNWTCADDTVGSFASRAVMDAYARLTGYGPLEPLLPPSGQHHEFRKDLKSLRYLLDMYRSLYPQVQMRDLRRHVKELQDDLGTINDVEESRLTGMDTIVYPQGWYDMVQAAETGALANWRKVRKGIHQLLRPGAY